MKASSPFRTASSTLKHKLNRRQFVSAASAAGAGLALGFPTIARGAAESGKPAILGGPKAHPGGFPGWPVIDQTEENAMLETLRSREWFRSTGNAVVKFEE